jgi:hypothetical protein
MDFYKMRFCCLSTLSKYQKDLTPNVSQIHTQHSHPPSKNNQCFLLAKIYDYYFVPFLVGFWHVESLGVKLGPHLFHLLPHVGHVISVLLVSHLIFPIEKQVFPFLEGMHSTE